jgi:hypothetical protein
MIKVWTYFSTAPSKLGHYPNPQTSYNDRSVLIQSIIYIYLYIIDCKRKLPVFLYVYVFQNVMHKKLQTYKHNLGLMRFIKNLILLFENWIKIKGLSRRRMLQYLSLLYMSALW